MLKGKTVVIGVTGSIAAYKTASLVSSIVKLNADVHVIMTKNAANFINPITFESLTGNKCLIDTFDRNFQFNIEHVALGERADVFMIAPASADIIGKIANGIADDMLSTTILAAKCHKFISPAMNTNMFENPIVQDNLRKLEKFGYEIIQPASGRLACGSIGSGKMPEPETLLQYILRETAKEKDLKGKHILITAGATQEKIDPVRYITNHSTGKMGYAFAECCMLRGAEVTLISGKTSINPPMFVKFISVTSAADMAEAVKKYSDDMDIIIKAAAVADYRPSKISDQKIKKSDSSLSIELERTEDILSYLGKNKKEGQFICGFSMETENLIENSRKKLIKKNVDMIAANNLKVKGAGFGTDTNVITLITKDSTKELELMSKLQAADYIMDYILENINKSKN